MIHQEPDVELNANSTQIAEGNTSISLFNGQPSSLIQEQQHQSQQQDKTGSGGGSEWPLVWDLQQQLQQQPDDGALVALNASQAGNASMINSNLTADFVPPYMQHMTTILVILHMSVFITGLVGNSLVCLSVYRNKSLQTVTNYYIVNLAVADFLVILICLPPTVYWDLTLTWNFGLVLCKLVLYLQSISVSVSVLTLTCISIDRWYAICRPLEFSSTKYRAKVTILLIWLISLLIASPDVIFLTTRPLYEENDYIYMDCTYSWPESSTKMYQLCIVSLLFIGPFVLMSISYWHIVNVLWRNEIMSDNSQVAVSAAAVATATAEVHSQDLKQQIEVNKDIALRRQLQQSQGNCNYYSISSSANDDNDNNKGGASTNNNNNPKTGCGPASANQRRRRRAERQAPEEALSSRPPVVSESRCNLAQTTTTRSPKTRAITQSNEPASFQPHVGQSASPPFSASGASSASTSSKNNKAESNNNELVNNQPVSSNFNKEASRCRKLLADVVVREQIEVGEECGSVLQDGARLGCECSCSGRHRRRRQPHQQQSSELPLTEVEPTFAPNCKRHNIHSEAGSGALHGGRQSHHNTLPAAAKRQSQSPTLKANKDTRHADGATLGARRASASCPQVTHQSSRGSSSTSLKAAAEEDGQQVKAALVAAAGNLCNKSNEQRQQLQQQEQLSECTKAPGRPEAARMARWRSWCCGGGRCCGCAANGARHRSSNRQAAKPLSAPPKGQSQSLSDASQTRKAWKRYQRNQANYAAKWDQFRRLPSADSGTGSGRLANCSTKSLQQRNKGAFNRTTEPSSLVVKPVKGSCACRNDQFNHHHHHNQQLQQLEQADRQLSGFNGRRSTNGTNNGQADGEGTSSVPMNQQQIQFASSISSSQHQGRFCKLIESRKKAAKMLIVIVIMFGLCYLPVHFLNILRYTIGLPQNNITTIASLVSHWLCYFNSAVNPLIYNLMSGKFRHEFANLFFCKCLF